MRRSFRAKNSSNGSISRTSAKSPALQRRKACMAQPAIHQSGFKRLAELTEPFQMRQVQSRGWPAARERRACLRTAPIRCASWLCRGDFLSFLSRRQRCATALQRGNSPRCRLARAIEDHQVEPRPSTTRSGVVTAHRLKMPKLAMPLRAWSPANRKRRRSMRRSN